MKVPFISVLLLLRFQTDFVLCLLNQKNDRRLNQITVDDNKPMIRAHRK